MSGKNRDKLNLLFLDTETFPSARIGGVQPPTSRMKETERVGKTGFREDRLHSMGRPFWLVQIHLKLGAIEIISKTHW